MLALSFNLNGNWVLTACRDSVLRLYDIRTLRDFQNLRGHKKEVTCAKWHPFHERHLVSGGSDGFLGFWEVGTEGPIAQVEQAHESQIWEADYHPMGHVLATASNDVTTRFWGRNRPGDGMDEAFLVGSEKGKRVKMGVVENDWDGGFCELLDGTVVAAMLIYLLATTHRGRRYQSAWFTWTRRRITWP